MILFYAGAGINHFISTALYLKIMPPWLPYPNALVLISGIAEIVCAVLLFFSATRRAGAWCIIALLLAILPANIQMLIDYYNNSNPLLWIAVVRIPVQFILIWWAYGFTKPNRSVN